MVITKDFRFWEDTENGIEEYCYINGKKCNKYEAVLLLIERDKISEFEAFEYYNSLPLLTKQT